MKREDRHTTIQALVDAPTRLMPRLALPLRFFNGAYNLNFVRGDFSCQASLSGFGQTRRATRLIVIPFMRVRAAIGFVAGSRQRWNLLAAALVSA